MLARRVLCSLLAGLLATGTSTLVAQTPPGVISGAADDTARTPYADYVVQLSEAATGKIVQTVKLDDKGMFAFSNVEMSTRYLVELVDTKINRVVCAEGPYALTAPNTVARTDVNIDCGAVPAAWWLLVAGAGTAAAVAFAVASPSGAAQ
jgi:hypothetical protein